MEAKRKPDNDEKVVTTACSSNCWGGVSPQISYEKGR